MLINNSDPYIDTNYPFVSSAGVQELLSEAIIDMSVYVTPDTKMPLYVEMNPYAEDTFSFNILDSDDNVISRVDYNVTNLEALTSIKHTDGYSLGFIRWDNTVIRDILRTYEAGSPLYTETLYISPEVCTPVVFNKPSVYIVDDTAYTTTYTFTIAGDALLYDNVLSILPASPYSTIEYPLTTIVWGDSAATTLSISNRFIIIRSEATCDLRVVTTSDGLYFLSSGEDDEQ